MTCNGGPYLWVVIILQYGFQLPISIVSINAVVIMIIGVIVDVCLSIFLALACSIVSAGEVRQRLQSIPASVQLDRTCNNRQ